MRTALSALSAIAALLFAMPSAAAPQVSKCNVNGTVSYQQGPCPADQVRRQQPTLEELNAAEKKRRAAAAASAATASGNAAAPAAPAQMPAPAPALASPTAASPAATSSYRCDGRRYCSQMKSCNEAKYFLANCPGVEMDGDGDGIPCERQLCGH
jgi:hypothetical protein